MVVGWLWLGWSGEYGHVSWYVPMLATIPIGCAIALVFASLLVSYPHQQNVPPLRSATRLLKQNSVGF